MICKEKGCGGGINMNNPISKVGCRRYKSAYPCAKCGRLYHLSGNACFNRQGKKAFLKDGKVAVQEKGGEFTII